MRKLTEEEEQRRLAVMRRAREEAAREDEERKCRAKEEAARKIEELKGLLKVHLGFMQWGKQRFGLVRFSLSTLRFPHWSFFLYPWPYRA